MLFDLFADSVLSAIIQCMRLWRVEGNRRLFAQYVSKCKLLFDFSGPMNWPLSIDINFGLASMRVNYVSFWKSMNI